MNLEEYTKDINQKDKESEERSLNASSNAFKGFKKAIGNAIGVPILAHLSSVAYSLGPTSEDGTPFYLIAASSALILAHCSREILRGYRQFRDLSKAMEHENVVSRMICQEYRDRVSSLMEASA